MIVWMVLIVVWSLVGMGVSHGVAWNRAFYFFFWLFVADMVAAAIYGSIFFLQYYQAWPFIPQ